MITDDEVAGLLRDSGQLLQEWDSSTELSLDSLTVVWLVHLLEERHGVVVGPDDEEELAASDTIGALRRNLDRLLRNTAEADGTHTEGARHGG